MSLSHPFHRFHHWLLSRLLVKHFEECFLFFSWKKLDLLAVSSECHIKSAMFFPNFGFCVLTLLTTDFLTSFALILGLSLVWPTTFPQNKFR